jgi:RNA polymerase sigma-70 factor (ECF subfamily)
VVRDAGIAEDILHDIFLNLWRSPQQFDGARGKLAPWLAVIARNRAIDWIRQQHPQQDLSEVQLVADEAWPTRSSAKRRLQGLARP